MDVSKLKVVELRAELASRGLDQKGVKAILAARLQEAIDKEEQLLKSDDEDAPLSEAKDHPGEEVTDPPPNKSPTPEEASAQSAASNTSQQEEDSSQFASYQEESESKQEESEVNDVVQVAEESREQCRDEESRGSESVAVDETSVQSSLAFDSNSEHNSMLNEREEEKQESVIDQNSSSASKEPESNDGWGQRETDSGDAAPRPSLIHDDSNAQDPLDAEQTEKAEMEVEKPNQVAENAAPVEDEEKDSLDSKKEDTEDRQPTPPEPRERRRNRWADADPVEAETAPSWQEGSEESKPSESRVEDEKMEEDRVSRKRERERSHERHVPSPPRRPDNEPFFDEKDVLLSWYDSDLHLIIDKDNFFSATLITNDGFYYVWAGVRATYGFEKGKIYFEVKATEDLDVSEMEDEPNPHILRVGWSIVDSSLQLGEEPLSFGYGSTGKISTNSNFQEFGKSFARGDVIGCYLDLDATPHTITYTLNGEELGAAFTIEPEELNGQALFPHILSKNQAFHVNFGEQEPWGTPIPDYTYVGKVAVEDRVAGPKRPEKREDCEVIMMIGLPGAGKTTWAHKYASEHKDKKFNILGTNQLLDKMKVMGLPRKRNYTGRWDHLINKCTRCLQTILDMGCQRRRNYIIDQTNVYPSAQRRKMRGFEGFVRRAVVIVPPDEDYKARTANREIEEGKEVPESAVLDMKANFALPEKDVFNSIEYVELQEEDAAALVKVYNKEANDAGHETKAPPKRSRNDDYERSERDRSDRPRGSGYGGIRGSYGRGRGGYDRGNRNGSFSDRGGNYNDRNRSGYGDRSGGYGDRGGYRNDRSGSGGGWRDQGGFNNRPRNDDRGGGWNSGSRGGGNWRDNRGGGGGGSGNSWGGGNRYGGNKDDRSGRGRDDRSSEKDKRPAGQGNWNQGQGYQQQAWQGFGNQWGNWSQGYGAQQQGQQPWKNYGQGWAQQAWNNQNWANWNQQYYNQAYQQGWGQQSQQAATAAAATTDASQTPATYSYSQSAATTPATQAVQWPGYGSGYGVQASQGAAASTNYGSAQK